MTSVLSTYAFTLFTPQLALEAIILMALFLVCSSLKELLRTNWRPLTMFLGSFTVLLLYHFNN